MNDLKTMVEAQMKSAEQVLILRGRLLPVFIMDTPRGLIINTSPFANEHEKAVVFNLIQLACVANDARALVSVVEVWMRTQMPGEPYIQPRKAADRRECVQVLACDVEGNQACLIADIRRGADGKPIGLGEPQSIIQEGALAGLLPTSKDGPPITGKHRELARAAIEEALRRGYLQQYASWVHAAGHA